MKLRWFSVLLAVVFLQGTALAHIGSLDVLYETQTPVPVRVMIRPPGVVPGLAEINVRVLTNGARRVTALPVHWRAGVEGAPPPDVAKPVEGETNLYHAQLWLMSRGAYSVHVNVETAQGLAKVIVPVNSLATTRLPMSETLGGILLGLGGLLFVLAVFIVGAAVRESVLPPGDAVSGRQLWSGRGAMVLAAILLALSLVGGRAWWNSKDRDYRNNRMHKPVECAVKVRTEEGRQIARLIVLTNEARASFPGLVPDHGKLMHAFLIREPNLDAFAHVHPSRKGHREFESALPPLPPGNYRVYADVTHETGFSQTLTASTTISETPGSTSNATHRLQPDPDDSSLVIEPARKVGSMECELGDGRVMKWERGGDFVEGKEASLRFVIREKNGELSRLEPYMSMLGHAVVRRDDGAVFTHLHPAGSVSVAAQQVFQIRAGNKAPKRITPEMMEQLCQPPSGDLPQQPLSFPYQFPKPGKYRVWVQVKIVGEVRTGVFDTEVKAGN